jgi:hypothetical protein
MRTIVFRESDGLNEASHIKVEAYDMRERYTSTCTLLGSATSSNMSDLKHSGRSRLKLESPNPDGRTAGFVTLNCWNFDDSRIPGSTDSTPVHRNTPNRAGPGAENGAGGRNSIETVEAAAARRKAHRRLEKLKDLSNEIGPNQEFI